MSVYNSPFYSTLKWPRAIMISLLTVTSALTVNITTSDCSRDVHSGLEDCYVAIAGINKDMHGGKTRERERERERERAINAHDYTHTHTHT